MVCSELELIFRSIANVTPNIFQIHFWTSILLTLAQSWSDFTINQPVVNDSTLT